jgi:hypothetical protein
VKVKNVDRFEIPHQIGALWPRQAKPASCYREIAAAGRVALGTVGPVIKELENRRHINYFRFRGHQFRGHQ